LFLITHVLQWLNERADRRALKYIDAKERIERFWDEEFEKPPERIEDWIPEGVSSTDDPSTRGH